MYQKHFGMGQDRFLEEKRQSNEFVLARMDAIRELVETFEKLFNSED